MTGDQPPLDWLLAANEPWTRLRTRLDLLGEAEDAPAVQAERLAVLGHQQVQELTARAAAWPGYALKRHNDAAHALTAVSVLSDFGLGREDDGISEIAEAILARQGEEGPFLTRLRLYKQFGGLDGEFDAWMWCDAPALLYALLSFGYGSDVRVQQAAAHLLTAVQSSGWPCAAAATLGKFHGPGRREDPCPMANVYALKALSLLPEAVDGPATRAGTEMLLAHWQDFALARAAADSDVPHEARKIYLFGVGSDFQKLKYPLVWYDILHVAEVLSRFFFVHRDARFQEMLAALFAQADAGGRFTASSMYRAWQGWSFADKKRPSPWLTFLVWRIRQRIGHLQPAAS